VFEKQCWLTRLTQNVTLKFEGDTYLDEDGMMIKTRFCPSPTGRIHIGNARTALFSALVALKSQGCFLLRIEDTDKERSSHAMAELMQTDLQWLRLEWQEGPGVEGKHAPYWQSQRQAIYDRYYQQLEKNNLAYPCFCSEQQLAMTRKAQRAAGKPPRYPGTCRSLTADDIAKKIAAGIKPALRFRIPPQQTVIFHDLAKGQQRFRTEDIGDFIIRRADGSASFMYCNAIDDALMGVTHVLRGEDHLTNTPRQRLILQALELPLPEYGHFSLITGSDGGPLSKRNGSQSILDLREAGYFPIAIVNYFARLGHSCANNTLMSLQELAEAFEFNNLAKAPARYDPEQLNYWQKQVVLNTSWEKLAVWCASQFSHLVPSSQHEAFIKAVQPNIIFPADAAFWAQAFFGDLVFDDEKKAILNAAGNAFFQAALAAVQQHGSDFKAISAQLKQATGAKGKDLFQPLRIAITGCLHGPDMSVITELMGAERLRQRFSVLLN
jgi:glutamyl-tRNA synthetase